MVVSIGSGSPHDRSITAYRMHESTTGQTKATTKHRAHTCALDAVRRAILVVKLGEGSMIRSALDNILEVFDQWIRRDSDGDGGIVVSKRDHFVWKQIDTMSVRELKAVIMQRGASVAGLVRCDVCLRVCLCSCMYICVCIYGCVYMSVRELEAVDRAEGR
jgi:hypothetical protein